MHIRSVSHRESVWNVPLLSRGMHFVVYNTTRKGNAPHRGHVNCTDIPRVTNFTARSIVLSRERDCIPQFPICADSLIELSGPGTKEDTGIVVHELVRPKVR